MVTTLLIKPVKIFIMQMRLSPLSSYSCINFCYQNEIPGVEYFFRRIRRKKSRRKRKKRKKMRRRRMNWKMKLFFVWG